MKQQYAATENFYNDLSRMIGFYSYENNKFTNAQLKESAAKLYSFAAADSKNWQEYELCEIESVIRGILFNLEHSFGESVSTTSSEGKTYFLCDVNEIAGLMQVCASLICLISHRRKQYA